jgi:integrase
VGHAYRDAQAGAPWLSHITPARPAVPDDEQGRPFLTPLEFAAVLQQSRERPKDHLLVGLLGMMGLRISEATQLDIEHNLGVDGGYETPSSRALTYAGVVVSSG